MPFVIIFQSKLNVRRFIVHESAPLLLNAGHNHRPEYMNNNFRENEFSYDFFLLRIITTTVQIIDKILTNVKKPKTSLKPIQLNYTNNFSLNGDAGKNRNCGRLPNWLIADRIARISIDRVGDPIGFLVVGSNEPWWCSKWKQDDRVYTGVHGRCSRRSRFHRRWAESRASRVPASPASRCVLALLGIVIGDKFSTAWPADIDFLPAWRHAYKLRPLQLIGAFTFERHVINCRLEEKTRDGNRARLSGPGILYTFPRASSRNQWPEPLMSPKENGNYCLSTVLPPINNEGWFLRFQKFPSSFFFP